MSLRGNEAQHNIFAEIHHKRHVNHRLIHMQHHPSHNIEQVITQRNESATQTSLREDSGTS